MLFTVKTEERIAVYDQHEDKASTIDSYFFYYCYYFFCSYCDQLCFFVPAPAGTEWVIDSSTNIWRQGFSLNLN